MKKVKKLPIIILLALTVLVAVSAIGFAAGKPAYAETDPAYEFEVEKYDSVYDIGSDCNIAVTEDITIKYKGYKSTGFIRDIPVNGGAQVRNVKVSKLVNGNTESVWYDVYTEDLNFLSIDIGDQTLKRGKSESYRITYNYIITNSVVNKSMLPLNVIGHGWDCYLNNISVKIILPDGFESAKCYTGYVGTNGILDFNESTENGRKVITTSVERLDKYYGITFDLNFEKGAIKNYTDLTPYAFALVGVAILAVLILLKLFVFNKNYLTPVVNYEAPNKMDPLLMGKLIDNNVNSEDVTSLIFYWASKGYLKINLDNKDDPVLIKIMHELPEPVPAYERLMYNNLFASGDAVKISQLKNKFYTTVEKVTNLVNKQTKGLLYTKSSQTLAFVFTLLSGILLGLAPCMLAFLRISTKYLTALPFGEIVVMIGIYAIAMIIMNNRLKYSKGKIILLCLAIVGIWLIAELAYLGLAPSAILGIGPRFVLVIICSLISALSVTLVTRTKQYTEQLNDIIGFKNFIALAEKDQLEMMLEEDPQFYYNILPYAQVLGVTDKWEDKFSGITVQPPQWLTGDAFTTYVEFRVMNGLIKSSLHNMSTGMVSRPNSSGVNGGGRGGFGGGFSGGGFGGGGGRGR